jgi:hypothetical protein
MPEFGTIQLLSGQLHVYLVARYGVFAAGLGNARLLVPQWVPISALRLPEYDRQALEELAPGTVIDVRALLPEQEGVPPQVVVVRYGGPGITSAEMDALLEAGGD